MKELGEEEVSRKEEGRRRKKREKEDVCGEILTKERM